MLMEELANRLIAWIREQVAGARRQGVVFGLSGGLDSAVVAVLCKYAFPDNALALILPCYSSKVDLEHAYAICQQFHISNETVVLDTIFDSLRKTLPGESYDAETQKMAEANMKPRLRMIALYYLANRLGYLVVGTGNRSEISIGYFTKYGDGGVDILPLGNLVKYQVRELAVHLGILKEIVDKPPSAGLWAGQTDEGEMGITYEELDRYLTTGKADGEIKKKVDAMMAGSAHKRATPAIPSF